MFNDRRDVRDVRRQVLQRQRQVHLSVVLPPDSQCALTQSQTARCANVPRRATSAASTRTPTPPGRRVAVCTAPTALTPSMRLGGLSEVQPNCTAVYSVRRGALPCGRRVQDVRRPLPSVRRYAVRRLSSWLLRDRRRVQGMHDPPELLGVQHNDPLLPDVPGHCERRIQKRRLHVVRRRGVCSLLPGRHMRRVPGGVLSGRVKAVPALPRDVSDVQHSVRHVRELPLREVCQWQRMRLVQRELRTVLLCDDVRGVCDGDVLEWNRLQSSGPT